MQHEQALNITRRHFLRELQAAGAKVLLYQPGMSHAKLLLVDKRTGLFGSANMDLRSLFVNFEIGVVVHSAADARAMKAWAVKLTEHCRELKAERMEKFRVLGNIAEDLSRLLAPLL